MTEEPFTLRRIAELERQAATVTAATAGESSEFAARVISHALAGLVLLEHRRLMARWQQLLVTLATRSFNSLYLAHRVIVIGYPAQAWSLIRSAYEDYLTAAYVHKHHGSARFWLAKKYATERYWRNVPSMKKRAAVAFAGQKRGPGTAYHILSQFTHPLSGGLSLLTEETPDAIRFTLGPVPDQHATRVAQSFLLRCLGFLLLLEGSYIRVGDDAWTERTISLLDELVSIADALFGNTD